MWKVNWTKTLKIWLCTSISIFVLAMTKMDTKCNQKNWQAIASFQSVNLCIVKLLNSSLTSVGDMQSLSPKYPLCYASAPYLFNDSRVIWKHHYTFAWSITAIPDSLKSIEYLNLNFLFSAELFWIKFVEKILNFSDIYL